MKNDFVKDLNRFGGLEFASFKLKEGVTEQDLFKAVDEMVEGLYLREKCFLGHCLLKGEDNIYVKNGDKIITLLKSACHTLM